MEERKMSSSEYLIRVPERKIKDRRGTNFEEARD